MTTETLAQTINLISAELVTAFPDTKFNIEGHKHPIGTVISISWSVEPHSAQVHYIVDKYQKKHFNKEILRVMYVYTQRTIE